MKKNKDEVTRDLVMAAAEQAARDRQVTVMEVTAREVRHIIGRGNDGYIGAHLQTVKIEYARAKLFEEKQISHHLMAALYDEIKRHVDNAREVEQAEAEVTKQMFDEICECNTELEVTLADKINELSELERAHADDVRNLKSDLISVQTEKSTLEGRLKDALDRVDKTGQELSGVREELTTVSVELGHVTKARDDLQNASKEQKDHLLGLEKELNQSRDGLIKAEQRADLLNWKNEDLSRQLEELHEKFDVMTERATEAEAELKTNGVKSGTRTTKTNGNKK